MNYRTYVEGENQISEIGFGSWQLGNGAFWSQMSDQEGIQLVRRALAEGVNFFDTAPGYGSGSSERILGQAFKHYDRRKIIINTKFGHTAEGKEDFSASSIRKAVEDSCRRLGTDYIDSILLHNPPRWIIDGSSKEHDQVFDALVKEGKIMAYGASLDTAEDMKLYMENCGGKVIEALFNINFQNAKEAFDLAKEKGVAIIAKVPMDSGWLSGKFDENSQFSGIRSRWSKEDIKTRAKLVKALDERLQAGQQLSQYALSYCLAYDVVKTVIPGSRTVDHLLSNLESLKYPMTKEEVKWLEERYEKTIKILELPW